MISICGHRSTGRILSCGIYRMGPGFEARMGYGGDHLRAAGWAPDFEGARSRAELFRQATLDNPRFAILTDDDVLGKSSG